MSKELEEALNESTKKMIEPEKILMNNKQIIKEIEKQDIIYEKTREVTNTNLKEIEFPMGIKPYTESQLSALYYNQELETLDDFIKQYVQAELKGN